MKNYANIKTICTLIVFSFTTYCLHAISDTTKTKYALNDPRNPDCPCHKYQKLADDEYKKLTEHPEEKKTNDADKLDPADKNSKENPSLHQNHHRKFLPLHKRKRVSNHHGRERKQKMNWSCFHWH